MLAEIRTLFGDVKIGVTPVQAASSGLVHAQVPTSSGNRHPSFDIDNSSISTTEQPSKRPIPPMTVETQSQSTQANARPRHLSLKVRLSSSHIYLLTSNQRTFDRVLFRRARNRPSKPATSGEVKLRSSSGRDTPSNDSSILRIRSSPAPSPEKISSLMVSSAGAKMCQVRQAR